MPAVPASGHAGLEEIRRRRTQLPDDLRHDPAFAEGSPWWDTWFYDEHDQRRRSFFANPAPRAPARPQRARAPAHDSSRGPVVKEEEDVEDEAFKKALEDSQLDELAEWLGLPVALAESAAAAAAAPLPPPPSPPAPEPEQQEPWPLAPLVGHSWAWTSTVPCTPEWVEPEQQEAPAMPPRAAMAIAPGAWPYPCSAPVYVDEDDDEDKGDGQ